MTQPVGVRNTYTADTTLTRRIRCMRETASVARMAFCISVNCAMTVKTWGHSEGAGAGGNLRSASLAGWSVGRLRCLRASLIGQGIAVFAGRDLRAMLRAY